MNHHFFKALVVSFALIFASVAHVEAARLGGGKSIGRAPSAPIQKQATLPQKPTQQAQPAAPTPAAAPQAPSPSRFGGIGGILGGLAAGLGIGYLLSHFGLGEAAASLLTGLLIAMLAGFVIMFLIRRMLPGVSPSGLQRVNVGQTPKPEPAFIPTSSAFSDVGPDVQTFQSTLPPGFDERTFLENAKQFFVTLQKTWDQGDLQSLREFTTPEMFARISQDLAGRVDIANQTDVITVNARLLGVETNEAHYFCSVQFSGVIREQPGGPADDFSEIWNLSKPLEGPGGWVLAGISQLV